MNKRLIQDRNNIVANSFSSAGVDPAVGKKIITNPESYFASVSPEEANHMRGIIIPAYRKGFRTIFLVGASLAALAFVVAFFMIPHVELSRPDDARLKAEAKEAEEKKKKEKATAA